MGSMPRLKIKDEIRYRKGHTNESQNCRYCVNFTEDELRDGVPGDEKYSMHWPGRCLLINKFVLAASTSLFGARAKIRSDYTCDRQEYKG
jgi:hypothetical protein